MEFVRAVADVEPSDVMAEAACWRDNTVDAEVGKLEEDASWDAYEVNRAWFDGNDEVANNVAAVFEACAEMHA